MNNLCDKLQEVCHTLGYKIKDIDNDVIIIRYQLHAIYIYYNEEMPDDCTVMIAIKKDVPEEERMQVLERCNVLNERLKYFKYYILGPGVVATIEFRFRDTEHLAFQLEQAVPSLSQAKKIFEQED